MRLIGTPRLLSAMAMVVLLGAAALMAQHLAERFFRERLLEHNRQTLDLYTANLRGTLGRFEALPGTLSHLPAIRRLLGNPYDPHAVAAANHLLAELQQRTGADTLYVMAPDGLTLASSNWNTPVSFVGGNFSFRPYFQMAMEGRLGRFFGLGTTSLKRGYYFADAVREGTDIIGVMVVKVDLDETETVWGQVPEQLMVTDAHGVVILSSQPSWRYHATRTLSAAERSAIASDIPYPEVDPPPLQVDMDQYLVSHVKLEEVGWTASVLAPASLTRGPVRSVTGVTAAGGLLLILAGALLHQRRRDYLERIAIQERARAELEQRVAERTRDLQALNDRLKREVLERQQAQDEIIRIQEELVRAGKLSALGTMSASISHELNQPLTAIRSYADNARVYLEHGRQPEAAQNLATIGELTGHMSSIIANLRAFARHDPRGPIAVDLVQALEQAVEAAGPRLRALGVEVHSALPDTRVWVEAGTSRLRQVLDNLLTNAADALEGVAGPRLRITVKVGRDDCRVEFADNGPGLTAEARIHAFDPFYTTKHRTQGLGLGLSICRNIVQALGGELTLDDGASGGAVAVLRLRLSERAEAEHAAALAGSV